MNKVVLDTNVLVSALLTNGHPAGIVDLIAEGKLRPFYSAPIMNEYLSVLRRSKFDFSPLQISRLIDDIVRAGIAVEVNKPSVFAMTDEDDRKFYDVAKASGAFLITGNKKHFPQKSFIVNPAGFMKLYNAPF